MNVGDGEDESTKEDSAGSIYRVEMFILSLNMKGCNSQRGPSTAVRGR